MIVATIWRWKETFSKYNAFSCSNRIYLHAFQMNQLQSHDRAQIVVPVESIAHFRDVLTELLDEISKRFSLFVIRFHQKMFLTFNPCQLETCCLGSVCMIGIVVKCSCVCGK